MMGDDRPDRCDRCRFFAPQVGHGKAGECRRYPPRLVEPHEVIASPPPGFGRWPLVAARAWCGEFQPIPAPIGKDPGRGMRAVTNPAPGSVPTE